MWVRMRPWAPRNSGEKSFRPSDPNCESDSDSFGRAALPLYWGQMDNDEALPGFCFLQTYKVGPISDSSLLPQCLTEILCSLRLVH